MEWRELYIVAVETDIDMVFAIEGIIFALSGERRRFCINV